jgi:uncharacterized protein YdcH (DUF465 family)
MVMTFDRLHEIKANAGGSQSFWEMDRMRMKQRRLKIKNKDEVVKSARRSRGLDQEQR